MEAGVRGVILADLPPFIGSGRVEVSQRGILQPVGAVTVFQDFFDEEL